jgi:hypothetical protein
MNNLYFHEVQRVRQVWIYTLILAIFVLWIWQLVQQVVLGNPVGSNPAPDAVVIIMGIIPVAALALMFTLKLETRVDGTGINYRMWPFHKNFRLIKPEDIEKWEVRKYRPIGDYGGWGIRVGLGKNGMAFNMSGNMGAIFDFKKGKRILIGTRKPEEFKAALEKLIK